MVGTGKKKSTTSGKKKVSSSIAKVTKSKPVVSAKRKVAAKQITTVTKKTTITKKVVTAAKPKAKSHSSTKKTVSTKSKKSSSLKIPKPPKHEVMSDVSDILQQGSSQSLNSLSSSSESAANNLMEHMDNIVGLPPLPANDSAKQAIKQSEEKKQKRVGLLKTQTQNKPLPQMKDNIIPTKDDMVISKEALDSHKTSFFNSLLHKKKGNETIEQKQQSKRELASLEDSKINQSLQSSNGNDLPDSLPPLPKLTETELRGLKKGPGAAKTIPSITSSTYNNNKDMTSSDVSKPNQTTAIEKPLEPLQEVISKKQDALDVAAKKGMQKALPPADETFKLEPKKGFFGKLFGGKDSSAKKYTVKKQKPEKPEKIVKPGKLSDKTVVDLGTLPKIVAGQDVLEQIEVPKAKDFPKDAPVKQDVKSEIKLDSETTNKTSVSPTLELQEEHKELPKIKDESIKDDSTNLSQSNGSSNAIEEAISADQSMPTLHSEEMKSDVSEVATGVVASAVPAVAAAVSVSSAPNANIVATPIEPLASGKSFSAESVENIVGTTSKPSGFNPNGASSQPKQYEHALQMSISKLEHKRDLLESNIKALELEYSQKKSSMEQSVKETEAQIAQSKQKEKQLDIREKELLERENVLLTLQSDMIAERKELDEREFKLFVKEEELNISLPKSPLLEVKPELVQMKTGLPPARKRIETLLNQIRKFILDGKFQEAMILYNQVAQEYHALELPTEELWEISLAIKEMYNDISVAMQQQQNKQTNQTPNQVNNDLQLK